MDRPLISVIIPVYNVEKYLDRCVQSVISQSYNNLEIILVDDGSPDNSPSLCDNWHRVDKRVKVIHQVNGGLSAARNAGLDAATGDFVTFIDSDDWIALDTYEYCINTLLHHDADSIEFHYITTKDISAVTLQPKEQILLYSNIDILRYYLNSSYKSGSYSVCRCIFPKYAVENVRFRFGKINEDIDFKFKVLRKVLKLVVSNQVKYYYYQHGISISSGALKQKDFDLYDSAKELYRLSLEVSDPTVIKLASYKLARTPFSLLCKIAYFGISDSSINKRAIVHKLQTELKQNRFLLLSSSMSFSKKILILCFCINFNFAEMIVSIVKQVYKPI